MMNDDLNRRLPVKGVDKSKVNGVTTYTQRSKPAKPPAPTPTLAQAQPGLNQTRPQLKSQARTAGSNSPLLGVNKAKPSAIAMPNLMPNDMQQLPTGYDPAREPLRLEAAPSTKISRNAYDTQQNMIAPQKPAFASDVNQRKLPSNVDPAFNPAIEPRDAEQAAQLGEIRNARIADQESRRGPTLFGYDVPTSAYEVGQQLREGAGDFASTIGEGYNYLTTPLREGLGMAVNAGSEVVAGATGAPAIGNTDITAPIDIRGMRGQALIENRLPSYQDSIAAEQNKPLTPLERRGESMLRVPGQLDGSGNIQDAGGQGVEPAQPSASPGPVTIDNDTGLLDRVSVEETIDPATGRPVKSYSQIGEGTVTLADVQRQGIGTNNPLGTVGSNTLTPEEARAETARRVASMERIGQMNRLNQLQRIENQDGKLQPGMQRERERLLGQQALQKQNDATVQAAQIERNTELEKAKIGAQGKSKANEPTYIKERDKKLAQNFVKAQEEIPTAMATMDRLNQLEGMIKTGDVSTGLLSNAMGALDKGLLGMVPGDWSTEREKFKGMAEGLNLSSTKQLMSGVITDTDMKLIQEAGLQYSKDPKVNLYFVQFMRAGLQRGINKFNDMNEWQRSGKSMADFPHEKYQMTLDYDIINGTKNKGAQQQTSQNKNNPLGNAPNQQQNSQIGFDFADDNQKQQAIQSVQKLMSQGYSKKDAFSMVKDQMYGA